MYKNYLMTIFLLIFFSTSIHAQICSNSEYTESSDLFHGQQDFGMRIMELLCKAMPNESIIFSPYSTYHALLLVYFSANGATEQELRQALRLNGPAAKSKADLRTAYRLEKKQQNEMYKCQMEKLNFNSAVRIYFDYQLKVKDLMDEFISLNFKDTDAASRTINSGIAHLTNNQITDAIIADDVNANTNLMLANVASFKGQWTKQFDPKNTNVEVFYVSATKMRFVQMMHKKGEFLYNVDESLGALVLQIPYLTNNKDKNNTMEESSIGMIIVLPPFVAKLEDILAKLNAASLKETLDASLPRQVDISLPKFELMQNLDLKPILQSIGINRIFNTQANFTDFTADANIFFDAAKHVVKLRIDEVGSTVKTASDFISFHSGRNIKITQFNCNHPFIFLIYDKILNAILFTGIYRGPQ